LMPNARVTSIASLNVAGNSLSGIPWQRDLKLPDVVRRGCSPFAPQR
jgi:hypothetical protein